MEWKMKNSIDSYTYIKIFRSIRYLLNFQKPQISPHLVLLIAYWLFFNVLSKEKLWNYLCSIHHVATLSLSSIYCTFCHCDVNAMALDSIERLCIWFETMEINSIKQIDCILRNKAKLRIASKLTFWFIAPYFIQCIKLPSINMCFLYNNRSALCALRSEFVVPSDVPWLKL